MKDLKIILLYTLIVSILIFIVGWYSSKRYYRSIYTERLEKGVTTTDTIYVEKRHLVEEVVSPKVIDHIIYDTVFVDKNVYLDVDTSKIIDDYLKLRRYSMKLFDNDTMGTLTIFPEVEFNKLTKVPFTYTPITKVITEVERKRYSLYGVGSIDSQNYAGIGVIVTKDRFGLGYKYNKNFSDRADRHEVQFLYRVGR